MCVSVGSLSLEALWFVAGTLLAYFLPRGSKVGLQGGLTVWGHVSGSQRNAVFKTHVWPGRPPNHAEGGFPVPFLTSSCRKVAKKYSPCQIYVHS